jgi:hypothetical protein
MKIYLRHDEFQTLFFNIFLLKTFALEMNLVPINAYQKHIYYILFIPFKENYFIFKFNIKINIENL